MFSPGQNPILELNFPRLAKGRIESIDELKGLAILLIIIYHAGGVLLWQNFVHGDVGVDMFVILSGLGLALSARAESAGDFLRRRLMRIFPAYWVVLTLFLLLNTHFLQHRYSVPDVIAHYFGVQAWFGDLYGFGINDSFWFVTLIVSLYLFYALIRPIRDRPDLVILSCALLTVPAAYAYFYTGQAGCYGHVALRIPGFFAGLLIGALLRDGRLRIRLTPALATALVLMFYIPYTHGIVFYSEIVAGALAMAYVYLWREKAPARIFAVTARYLRFFGKYSLEIFLFHQPLIRDYNYYLHGRWQHESNPPAISLIFGMAIGLGVTLVLSVELHRLLERLLRSQGRRAESPAKA